MLELVQEIANGVGIDVQWQGGLHLIHLRRCRAFVEECKRRSVLILGIEAFRLENETVVPEIELIADFSQLTQERWDVACAEAASSAGLYFDHVPPTSDLWFEFVLESSSWSRPTRPTLKAPNL